MSSKEVSNKDIVYLTAAQGEFFANEILHDPIAHIYLNKTGAREMRLASPKSDEWKALFCIPNIVVGSVGYDCARSVAHIGVIYVVEDQRNNGYGRIMHSFLEDFATKRWREAIGIESLTIKGSTAEEYKERYGYENAGVYRNFYGPGLDQTLWFKRWERKG